MSDTLESALAYAARGQRVIPLESIEDGRCTCGKADCQSPGKHPCARLVPHGLKDATTDPATIRRWWQRFPGANVGIVTGAVSGIIAIDIDPRHGGNESWADLIEENGCLPATATVATGGGGTHYYFRHPGYPVGNRSGVRPGIDVRGDNGYLVSPPSNHETGHVYRWLTDDAPADAPAWLLDLIRTEKRAEPAEYNCTQTADDTSLLLNAATAYAAKADSAVDGTRNNAAFGLAGHLASFVTPGGARLAESQILELVAGWNLRNQPPLARRELATAVHSAMTGGTPRPDKLVEPRRRMEPIGSKVLPIGNKAGTTVPYAPAAEQLEWEPFPTDALPQPLRAFVVAVAKAVGCDDAYVVLPTLAACAAAIGTTRTLRLKHSWYVPSVLWCVSVGESGSAKSPPFKAAVRFVRDRQREALERYAEEAKTYAVELAQYEKAYAEWKRSKTDHGEPPQKPVEPQATRYVVADTTIEALAVIILANLRGLLLARDEVAGWLGSFDRYASGKAGADEAAWLSMHSAESLTVDRKTGNPKTIHVSAAAVSICGTIQPSILTRCMGTAHRESGLLARLLLANPPKRAKRWSEADISEVVENEMRRLFRGLYALEAEADEEGRARPAALGLTPEAKALWVEWYNDHGRDQAEQTGDLAAAYSKLEETAARLALVFHCVRLVTGDPTVSDGGKVDAESIRAGVVLSRWFCREARRLYGVFSETDEEREARRLVEFIGQRGGRITARELQQGPRAMRGPGVAEAALEELAKAGYGTWQDVPAAEKGGRPSRVFTLATVATATKPQNSRDSGGCVAVASVAAPEIDPNDLFNESAESEPAWA